MKNQIVCKSCVLPETSVFPLDENGNCRLCNAPDLFKHILKKPDTGKLSEIIELVRKNGKGR